MSAPKFGQFSAKVSVTGRASARWKGASSREEALRLNQALSERRAQGVQALVKQILEREVPGLDVAVDTSAVGSRLPAEMERPGDDEAINRSVVVRVDLTSKTNGTKVVPTTRRVDMRSHGWVLHVNELASVAVAAAGGRIFLTLENSLSKQRMRYTAWLGGGGLSASAVKHAKKLKLQKALKWDYTVGRPVHFVTDERMGFADFEDQWITVGQLEAALIIGAEYSYLTFNHLGDGADLLAFDHGLTWDLSLGSSLMTGQLTMVGTPPPDWVDEPAQDVIPMQTTNGSSDAMVVSFPTGKGDLSDLTEKDRRDLTEFVTQRAKAMALLLKYMDPMKP